MHSFVGYIAVFNTTLMCLVFKELSIIQLFIDWILCREYCYR